MLPRETEQVWNFLKAQPALAGMVLVGGTALLNSGGAIDVQDLNFYFSSMAEHTLTVGEAEGRLHTLVERAHRFRESTLLLQNGKAVACVVPAPKKESTAQVLADWWRSRAPLGVTEAEAFENDLAASRAQLRSATDPWA